MKCYFKDKNTIHIELDTEAKYQLYENDTLLKTDYYTTITLYHLNVNIYSNYYIKINDVFYEVDYDCLYDENIFDQFNYDGILGVEIKNRIFFTVWAPKKNKIELIIEQHSKIYIFKMNKENGVFKTNIELDFLNSFYYYKIYNKNEVINSIDPYAYCTINNKGYLIDLSKTIQVSSLIRNIENNSHIIYETHITDYTYCNEKFSNKYLGLIENINHIIDLGITDVQLLPIYDYEHNNNYNWGYMPLNYNSLSSVYACNELDKINEFKHVVNTLHENNIGIIMDVVYNHTSFKHCFNSFVPGYFYRKINNEYCNASGCGNELSTTRYMTRKFIIDSVCFWAKEYKLSGFRFDLMAILDVTTINILIKRLKQINKEIMIYGEPWSALDPSIDYSVQVNKENINKIDDLYYFNDTLRDLIKGSVFDEKSIGFIQGDINQKKSLFNELNKLSVHYVSCHDNFTLFDKIKLTTNSNYIEMQKQANAIVLLSIGISFIHSGAEICRTKKFIENSYISNIDINKIDFNTKEKYIECYTFYKNIISFKRKHTFNKMEYIELDKNILSYKLNDFLILHNSNKKTNLTLDKEYRLVFHNKECDIKISNLILEENNTYILL